MKEKFTNAMVTCAAIVVFTGGMGAVVNGASSLVDLKVNSLLVQREQAQTDAKIAAEESGVVGTIVTGAKKLLK